MIYVGIDLHKNLSVITMMDARGKQVVKQKKLANNGGIVKL